MDPKTPNRRVYLGFVTVCVITILGVLLLAAYRLKTVFTTDWREFFQQIRLVDYLITIAALVMIFVFFRLGRSKR